MSTWSDRSRRRASESAAASCDRAGVQIQPFDIVIYHSGCYDGFGSAWVARQHSPGGTFIPAQHGDSPPDVAGKRVLICDFSYSRAIIEQMWSEAVFVMVLDHHKTAQADLDGLATDVDVGRELGEADGDRLIITFDMERSGVGLTWDTLMPRQPRPRLVDHIEDRDLWRFWIPGTREVQAALSTMPFDFDLWTQFADELEADPQAIEREGGAVLSYIANTCAKLASRARLVRFDDVDVWAVNAPPELLSETAELLKAREPQLPILAWSWDGERGNFYCSLRSAEDGVDVSEIAQTWGGGGHRHAAGFRMAIAPTVIFRTVRP